MFPSVAMVPADHVARTGADPIPARMIPSATPAAVHVVVYPFTGVAAVAAVIDPDTGEMVWGNPANEPGCDDAYVSMVRAAVAADGIMAAAYPV